MTLDEWHKRNDKLYENDIFFFAFGGLGSILRDSDDYFNSIISYYDCYGTMYAIARTTGCYT